MVRMNSRLAAAAVAAATMLAAGMLSPSGKRSIRS